MISIATSDTRTSFFGFSLGASTPRVDGLTNEGLVRELIAKIEDSHRHSAAPNTLNWLQMRVERIENESDEVKSFYLAATNSRPLPKSLAGQHVLVSNSGHISSEDAAAGRKPVSRCYTLSSTANPRYWRISVKRQAVPGEFCEQSLSNYLHEKVSVGDHLQVKGPRGHFTIEKAGLAPVLLFGAGVGVTPVVAMATALAEQQSDRPIWIFYQTQTPEQAALAGELIRLTKDYSNVTLNVAFSKIENLGKGHRASNMQFLGGRVDPKKLAEMTPHFQTGHCFLCGPSQWMQDTIEALEQRGFAKNRIHYESFGSTLVTENTSTETSTTVSDGFSVSCKDSKVALNFQVGQGSLLDQLQRAGADVAGGCRVGDCGTCMTKLLRGNLDRGATNCPDLQEGWILPCVAIPQSDVELQL